MLGIAEALGHVVLHFEVQPLLGAAGEEMQIAAHRPQEIAAAEEERVFRFREDAFFHQLMQAAHAIDILGDPEQRMEIAQAPLAVLDVGLDEIARLPRALVALVALGELRGDEIGGGALHDVAIETRDEIVEQRLVAGDQPRLQDRRADRHVGARLPNALVDRARGVADLQPHVPQRIENRFGDALAPGGLLVGKDKEKIDVGARREQAAAVAADRDHRHALARRRVRRAIEHAGRELIGKPDDRIHQPRQPLGAGGAVTVLEQQGFGALAALDQRTLHALRESKPHVAVAAFELVAQRVDLRLERRKIEQLPGGREGA